LDFSNSLTLRLLKRRTIQASECPRSSPDIENGAITLTSVLEDGSICFSGLHPDILIYRRAKNEVEMVETKGEVDRPDA